MAQRDFYDILGVARQASADEIRRAYRALARRWHPDVNNSPEAQAKFAEVQQAYDVLGDEQKRRLYDTYGPSMQDPGARTPWGGPGGERQARPGHAPFDVDDIGSMFESIFGGGAGGAWGARGGRQKARTPPREPARVEVRLPFATILRGGTESLRVSEEGGTRTIEFKVPPGVSDGTTLRVRTPSGGEVLISVRTIPHPYFRRGEHEETGKGLDLFLDVPVSIVEATLGASVSIPTPEGTVEVTLPAGTTSGKRLRVRGRGLADATGQKGDLYAVVRVVPPKPGEVSEEDRAALRRLAGSWRSPREALGW